MLPPRSNPTPLSFVPRETCLRCMRPAKVCWCAHLPRVESPTRVLFLQHPREEFMPIGTARMASMCLPGSSLVVGTTLDEHPEVRAVLDDPSRTPILLWPGPGAKDLAVDPPRGPVSLVVVDGTWSLAKKLVRLNPRVAALPRYALTPDRPSEYRIRAEPSDECVSTIEAVITALGLIDGDRARYDAMMVPFRAMIDAQIDHEAQRRGARARKRKRAPSPRPVPEELRRPGVVVVGAEANAWPYETAAEHRDELVQWCAVRLDDGARLEAIVAPTGPLSPTTPSHTRLSPEMLAAGVRFADLAARWRAFVRDDDVIASWGPYAVNLFADAGGHLPDTWVDLRRAAMAWLRGKPGSVADFVARQGLAWEPLGAGRGGERLGMAAAVATMLRGA